MHSTTAELLVVHANEARKHSEDSRWHRLANVDRVDLESELEDVPVEVKSTVADAVRDTQSFETRQAVHNDRQSQMITRHCRIAEINKRFVLDLFFHFCTYVYVQTDVHNAHNCRAQRHESAASAIAVGGKGRGGMSPIKHTFYARF